MFSAALSACSTAPFPMTKVGNFRQKNYSAEDGIDGKISVFRWNSGCSAEQKTLGIPFQTIPQRRKMFGILCDGIKIGANSQNSVLNHSGRENNFEFHGTKIKANTWNSVPNHSAEEKTTRKSVPWNTNRSKLLGFSFEAYRV
jgi:hypothetical protein